MLTNRKHIAGISFILLVTSPIAALWFAVILKGNELVDYLFPIRYFSLIFTLLILTSITWDIWKKRLKFVVIFWTLSWISNLSPVDIRFNQWYWIPRLIPVVHGASFDISKRDEYVSFGCIHGKNDPKWILFL